MMRAWGETEATEHGRYHRRISAYLCAKPQWSVSCGQSKRSICRIGMIVHLASASSDVVEAQQELQLRLL